MTIQEYQEFVKGRTFFGRHPDDKYEIPRLMYFALGLGGEASELLEKQHRPAKEILLEAGDVAWYLTAAATELNLDLGSPATLRLISQEQVPEEIQQLVVACGRFQEHVKKYYRDDHGQLTSGRQLSLAGQMNQILEQIFRLIASFANSYGFALSDVFDMNRAKLEDRDHRGTARGDGDNR